MWRVFQISTLLAGVFFAAPAQAPKAKLQALILTGQSTHDWRATTPLLRKMLEDTGRFEVRVMEEFRGAGSDTIAPYDVLLLNYFSDDPALQWPERTTTAVENFVRAGKGFVVVHVALAAFPGWDAFEKMCGGNLRPNHGHHSPSHEFTVDIKDRDHPITRGMKPSFHEPLDDLYANAQWQPDGGFHILATAWDDHSRYAPGTKQPIPGPGRDEPMMWTVDYGKGRVFATTLGHGPDAMNGAGFISILTRGAEWAATGAVTIPLKEEVKASHDERTQPWN